MLLSEPLDQATGLRRLFAPTPAFHAVGVLGPEPVRSARVALALARGLGRLGGQVLVLDEARPPANVGGQLGLLTRPLRLDSQARVLAGLSLGAGAEVELINVQSGLHDLADLDEATLIDLTEGWGAEAPEWLLVNGDANGLAAACDQRVLALPGSRTRLAQAYAVMKQALQLWPDGHWQVVILDADEDVARGLFDSLASTAQRFLGQVPGYLGCLPRQASTSSETNLAENLLSSSAQEALSFGQYWQRAWLYSHASHDPSVMRARNAGRP